MKSSRSVSAKTTRRNARRFNQFESSDDSDNAENVDSARAEKVFSRRRLRPASNNENVPVRAGKLFQVSSTSDSDSMHRSQNNNANETLDFQDESSVSTSKKLSNVSNTCSEPENDSILSETDQNDLEKNVDTSVLASSENDTNDESFFMKHKKLGNKQRIISDSSSESDVELTSSNKSVTPVKKNVNSYRNITPSSDDVLEYSHYISTNRSESKSGSISETGSSENEEFLSSKEFENKQRIISDSSSKSDVGLTSPKKSVQNETLVLDLDSDSDDIVNSSNEILPTLTKEPEESSITTQLEDLSLIECSDSDDISIHCKSTISSSSVQKKPFLESVVANSAHSPLSQSSILENVNFVASENTSNVLQNTKTNDVINLDNYFPKTTKVSAAKHNPTVIDLTKNDVGVSYKNSVSSVASGNTDSLKMEKKKLEELMNNYTSNINSMKNTIKTTNLNVLPDRGAKLKTALNKNEALLKDTKKQLKKVLEKLKNVIPEKEFKSSPQHAIYPVKLNVENALTKRAAANIDLNAMGNKALNTYRTQQVMTLDVLSSLHSSLKSCPNPNTLSEDPKGLKVELMAHQKYAISWMMWREKQKPHGGVLADDMGLGKTLTMISLILKDSDKLNESEDSDSDSEDLENRPSASIKGGTLIVCPSSLISQWQSEIKTKIRSGILDIIQHYGPSRETSARRLARKHIVLTTYNVVMWDQKNHLNTSPIFQIKWNRIILDEAHAIRNYKSQTSIAVSNIMGVNRWALSGTPVHNKESDFYALLKFIRCRPFDDWAVWKRWVGNNDEAGKNRLSLLVKTLMLRRTKAELSEMTSFNLPTKTFHTVNVELFKEEKEAYEKVLLFSRSLFSSYLYEKAMKENAIGGGFPLQNKLRYKKQQQLDDNVFKDHPELDGLFKQFQNSNDIKAHHILVLLLRLRQLCCHPCLMKKLLEADTLKVDGIQESEDIDLIDTMSRMSIGVPSVEKPTLSESNPIFKDSWLSSKIKAVCDMVKQKVLQTEDKAVIVSQWPSMLILIGKQLAQSKVKTELFSGAVPMPHRNKLVEDFNNLKGGPKVLLLSLTAGGVGLNLVAANHLFLVDVHWNPQLEAQACDRIYRVGQTKPVNIYKFICTNTIESSIKDIQDNKLKIANNLFGGCSEIGASKVTLEELKQIFRINK